MRVYYRKVRATGVWHILHTAHTTGDELRALCGECCLDCLEGYAPAPGRQRQDPPAVCARCKLVADGATQMALPLETR
jgi:hypothetical protein